MGFEVLQCLEKFWAVEALEGFVFLVNGHVLFQVFLVLKGLVTLFALEDLQTRLDSILIGRSTLGNGAFRYKVNKVQLICFIHFRLSYTNFRQQQQMDLPDSAIKEKKLEFREKILKLSLAKKAKKA